MNWRLAFWGVFLLCLTGCEYRPQPTELIGRYKRPGTPEGLILRPDGTAVVQNLPGHPAEVIVKWTRSPAFDEWGCLRLDFQSEPADGVEWHTCANKVWTRKTVFIGYPYGDPDVSADYEKVE